MKKIMFLLLLLLTTVILLTSCSPDDPTLLQNPQQIASVPYGEPSFPNLGKYWVIDTKDWVSEETEKYADTVLEGMKAKGYAETAIVLMSGVNNTLDYTTQLGRYLRLGAKDGPNRQNGLVWVLYIDKGELHYSIGDGLNELTAIDMDNIKDKATVYISSQNYNQAVRALADATAKKLQEEFSTPEAQTTPQPEGEGDTETLSTEQKGTLVLVVLIVIAAWTIFCLLYAFVTGDTEGAIELWMLLLRIVWAVLRIFLFKGGGRSGSGDGSFGGRSR